MWRKELIDVLFSLGLFANAILFIPQAIKILKTKSAKNISLITFGGINLIQLSMILHGYIIKDYLLVFWICISLFTCGFVTFLTILYKDK